MVTLWKANTAADRGWSYAERRECAEAYLDNPGFGGPQLYVAQVEAEYVLDLTRDAYEALAAALLDDEEFCSWWQDSRDEPACAVEVRRYLRDCGDHVYHTWELSTQVAAALARAYRWVRYHDDYPSGCITWQVIDGTPIACEEAC